MSEWSRIFEVKLVIPIICFCIACCLAKYVNSDFFVWGIMSLFIIAAELNHRIKMNYKLHNIIAACCFIPCLFCILGFLYIPLIVYYWMQASYRTPAEIEAERQANARYEAEALNRKTKEMLDKCEQTINTTTANTNNGNYGIGTAPLPPGGYKLCRIFAKLHDGTTATFHSIGLEHQVSELVKNDPRFEWADVSIDSPSEYGRYGLY